MGLVLLGVVFVPVSAHALSDSPSTTPAQGGQVKLSERITAAKEAAKEKTVKAKEAAKERKLTMAQSKCDAMKDRLVATVPKLATGVKSVKSTLDKNYERIQAIHNKGTLSAPNYDELAAAVEVAKASAETSIALIDPSSVTVDCAAKGLGMQLDSYRSTVKEARTDLKAYREALVNLVSAMNASEKTTNGDTTNENN